MVCRFAALLGFITYTTLALSPLSAPHQMHDFHVVGRPLRAGMIKLAPGIDKEKPIGGADFAGATVFGDTAILNFEDGWVGAINLHTRKLVWSFQSKAGLSVPPIISGKWLVFCLQDGRVLKVDGDSLKLDSQVLQKRVWETQLDSFVARQGVLVDERTLILVSANQTLYALDFETGKNLWNPYDAGAPENLAIRNIAPALVSGGVIYFGVASGDIVALKLANGEQIFRYNLHYRHSRFKDPIGDMRVYGSYLVLTLASGVAMSIRTDNPSLLSPGWVEPILVNSITANFFRQKRFYFGTANGYVYSHDVETGAKNWEAYVGGSVSHLKGGENFLLVVCSDGKVLQLVPATGEVLWADDLKGSIVAPPMMHNKTTYVMTQSGVLYGFKIE